MSKRKGVSGSIGESSSKIKSAKVVQQKVQPTLSQEENDCFKGILDLLLTNSDNPNIYKFLSKADNGLLILNKVSGIVYGDNHTLYNLNPIVGELGMNGQGTQAIVREQGSSMLIEQYIPFTIRIEDLTQPQMPYSAARAKSFEEKNGLSETESGMMAAAFLINMLLNENYHLEDSSRLKIKTQLIAMGICNTSINEINWKNVRILLMPGVYPDYENTKSLIIEPKKYEPIVIGGKKRPNKTKKRKPNKKKTTKKRRKSTRKRY
jgi:hypothetical protein